MDRLRSVSRTSPVAVLREIWSRKSFLGFFAWSKTKASLSESRTSLLWWIIEPSLKILVYGAIFGLILPASTRPENFVVSLIIGVAIFETYSTQSGASTRFFAQSDVIEESTSISPWSLMMSTVIETYLKSAALIVIVFGAALLLGVSPRLSWLAFPLLFAGYGVFLYSMGLILAALSRFFPTFPRLLGALNRVVFYGSGIFWSIERVLASYPTLLSIAELNPVYQIIQLGRAAVMGNGIDWGHVIALHSLVTVVLFAVGGLLFHHANKSDHA